MSTSVEHRRRRRPHGQRGVAVAVCALLLWVLALPRASAASPPPTPGGVTAEVVSVADIHVSWNPSPGATSYAVTNGDVTRTVNGTGFDWVNLAQNTYMCSAVSALNGSGHSAWSAWSCATTKIPPPINLSVVASSPSTIHASWTDNSGGTYTFNISNGNTTRAVGHATTFDYGFLQPGTYMCARIQAQNGLGTSDWTAWACATTPVPAPTNPAVVASRPDNIHLTWTDTSNGVASFLVTNGNSIVSVPAGSTSYDWTVSPGTYQCEAVLAAQGSGYSPWSPWACATTPAANQYVNLGDSFSSGEGVGPPYQAGTDVPTNLCHRSDDSYAGQFVRSSAVYHGVTNVACSGGTTHDIASPAGAVNNMQIPSSGEAAQISMLSSSTKLVTVSIGGNNLNLAGIFYTCYTQWLINLDGCFKKYFSDAFISSIGSTLDNGDQWGPGLLATYRSILDQAPGAKVVVVTYPQVFPAVFQPGACLSYIQSQDQLDRIRRVISTLDTWIKLDAPLMGFTVLDEENAFAGHEICSDPNQPWWANGFVGLGTDETFHPNALGYAQMAADLKRLVG